jgi:hypothetical protein
MLPCPACFLPLMMLSLLLVGSFTSAQESAPAKPKPKPESYLLLPEPRIMRSVRSLEPGGSEKTVLSPAKETTDSPFIATYSAEEFQAIGISPETFAERARTAADRLLKDLKPEWVQDEQGQVLYAVYRGERPIYASLMVAPSLPQLFEAAFGPEIWIAAPDRNALYIFPAKAAILSDFASDLEQRFRSDPYAATGEIFSWKTGKSQPVVVGSFTD